MAPSRRAVAIACKPGDAGADDEHPRRRHRAGGGHHHREAALERAGRLDHRAVAGEVGLAGQHVHRLGAGDARQQFHRRACRCRPAARLGHELGIGEGVGGADQQRAARDQGALLGLAASGRRRRSRHRPARRPASAAISAPAAANSRIGDRGASAPRRPRPRRSAPGRPASSPYPAWRRRASRTHAVPSAPQGASDHSSAQGGCGHRTSSVAAAPSGRPHHAHGTAAAQEGSRTRAARYITSVVCISFGDWHIKQDGVVISCLSPPFGVGRFLRSRKGRVP